MRKYVTTAIAALALAMTSVTVPTTIAVSAPMTCADAPEYLECGTYGDGVVDEDEAGWDCATMGNRICAPTSIVAAVPQ